MSCRLWSGSLAIFLFAGCLLMYLPWQMVLFVFAIGGVVLSLIAYRYLARSVEGFGIGKNLIAGYKAIAKPIDFASARASKKCKIYQFPVQNEKTGSVE